MAFCDICGTTLDEEEEERELNGKQLCHDCLHDGMTFLRDEIKGLKEEGREQKASREQGQAMQEEMEQEAEAEPEEEQEETEEEEDEEEQEKQRKKQKKKQGRRGKKRRKTSSSDGEAIVSNNYKE